MLIQVDVDSTLYPSDKLFNKVAADFDVNWPTKYSHWFHAEEIGTTTETLKNIFKRAHSREFVLQNKPYPYAAEVLRGIVKDFDEVEIAYVSDRNQGQATALKDWLDQEGFLNNPDQHVLATKDKREWMREARPAIVIDDRVRTMLFSRFELDAQVISLEHPYNINLRGECDGIYIVPTWQDIDIVLRGKIIPSLKKQALSRELSAV